MNFEVEWSKIKISVLIVEVEEIAVEKNGEPAAASTSVCKNETHEDFRPWHGPEPSVRPCQDVRRVQQDVKVRTEMETLLREIKDQVRQISSGIGDDASKPCCNLESTASSCLTDTNKNERASACMEDQTTSLSNHTEEVSCEKSAEFECFPRMDVLEEEFHAELDLLQVYMVQMFSCSCLKNMTQREKTR